MNESAAKQDAFEEANRLKNQFRSLDEDEIEFLDSVLESTRAEELRVKKETAEGLELFRKQQEEADKKLRAGIVNDADTQSSPAEEEEQWASGTARKRKRQKEKEGLKGVKRRNSALPSELPPGAPSTTLNPPTTASKASYINPSIDPVRNVLKKNDTKSLVAKDPAALTEPRKGTTAPAPSKGSLGLVDYGSDEDDD